MAKKVNIEDLMVAERERIVEEAVDLLLLNMGLQIKKVVEEVLNRMNFDAFMDEDEDILNELQQRIRWQIYTNLSCNLDYEEDDEEDDYDSLMD